jgi:hypothetical protein
VGWTVAGTGDLDGDDVGDLLVGAVPRDPYAPRPGYLRVISGRDGSLLYRLDGAEPGDRFGRGLAPTGDVDGDGRCDFAVAAPGDPLAAPESGSVTIFAGRDGSVLTRIFGIDRQEFFGGHMDAGFGAPGEGSAELWIGGRGSAVDGVLGTGRVVLVDLERL